MSIISIGDHAAFQQEVPVADFRVLSNEELDQVVGGCDDGDPDLLDKAIDAVFTILELPYEIGRKIGKRKSIRSCPVIVK